MTDDPRRVLTLAGARNLRDIGGYRTLNGRRTRWRTVFRSDCLDRLTIEAQAELLSVGLRTVIDLREHSELVDRPNVFAQSADLKYRWIPFWEAPITGRGLSATADGYLRELDLRGERIAYICRELLDPASLPALIHCAAGKDRTGLVIAVLLSVAGVPRDVIVEDYAMSAACLGDEFLEEGRQWVTGQGWAWAEYAHLWDSPPERMLRTLDHLDDRWRGAATFLLHHGLDQADVAQLRDHLTEALD